MKRKIIVVVCLALFLAITVLSVFVVGSIRKSLYPREYSEYVTKYCAEYSVPESLVYAVIYTESRFDPEARSHVGAIGLMQLMPDTLDWLSRLLDEEAPTGEITDPETNVKYGTYYLRHLYNRFGSWETALAAYNAGHGRVGKWLEDKTYSDDGKTLKYIPIKETRDYVNKVSATREEYISLYYKEGEKN